MPLTQMQKKDFNIFNSMVRGNFTEIIRSMQPDNHDNIKYDTLDKACSLGWNALAKYANYYSKGNISESDFQDFNSIAFLHLAKFDHFLFWVSQIQDKVNISLKNIEDFDLEKPFKEVDNYFIKNGVTYENLEAALINGNGVLKYFMSLGAKMTTKDIPGHDFASINTLMQGGVKLYDENTGEEIIRSGVQPTKYLIENGAVINQYTVHSAISDSFEATKYLVEEVGVEMRGDELSFAACEGDIATLEYLLSIGIKVKGDEISSAASCEKIDNIRYLLSKGAYVCNFFQPGTGHILDYVASEGDLYLIKQLMEIGVSIGRFSFSNAVRNGHHDIAKFMVEHGASFREDDLSIAIHEGNKEIVQLLFDNGLQVTDEVLTSEAPFSYRKKIFKDLVLRNENYSQNEELLRALEAQDFDLVRKIFNIYEPITSPGEVCYTTVEELQLFCQSLGYGTNKISQILGNTEEGISYLCDYQEDSCAWMYE